jgi:putative MATE family efflux protein
MLKNHDLTRGPILPAVLRLAGPAVLMMMLQGMYNFMDTFFVGALGANALAGISTGGFILWMTFALSNLIGVGLGAKVSRRIGEGDQEEAECTALRGLVYCTALSVLVAVPLYFLQGPLFTFMQTTPTVTRIGIDYMTPLLFGLPTIFLSFAMTAVFNAAGDTATPFILMLLSLAFNAVLAPILIFGMAGAPMMGVAGAAWATVIARAFWIVLALRHLLSKRSVISLRAHGRLGATWADMIELFRIGAPKASTGVLFAAVYMALTRVTSHYGTPNVAALRLGHIYEGLSFFTAIGFSIAASTMVGQNLGAGKPERAARAAWVASGIVFAFTTLVALLFRFGAAALTGVFSTDRAVIEAGASYLIILAWSQPFMGIELTLEGAFNGAGDTVRPMAIQLPLTVLRYPFALLLCFTLGFGVNGVWWAITGSSIIKGALMALWFWRGRWARTKV